VRSPRIRARHFERAEAAGIEEDLAVVVQVLFSLFVAVAAAWFWPFRARPGLLALRARPAAHILVLGLTVLLIGIELVRIGSVIADVAQPATWTISSVAILLWAVIVAFGHPGYSIVLRLTGGPAGSR
jgi:hypothetical protein